MTNQETVGECLDQLRAVRDAVSGDARMALDRVMTRLQKLSFEPPLFEEPAPSADEVPTEPDAGSKKRGGK